MRIHRRQQLRTLKSELHWLQTSPFLVKHIMRSLAQWIMGVPVPYIDLNDVPDQHNKNMAKAFNIQIRLGISNMVRGLLANELKNQQSVYYSLLEKKEHGDGSMWPRKVILLMLTFTQACWKFRCEAVHTITESNAENRLRSECETLYFQLKTDTSSLPFQYSHFLNRHNQFFKTAPIPNLWSWLRSINIGLKMQNDLTATNTMDIRAWLYKNQVEEKRANDSYVQEIDQYPSVTTLPFIPSQNALPETDEFT